MRRVLIGWQFGGGHGHVTKMVAVGRALAERGWEVLLAARDLTMILPVTRDAGFPVLPVPLPVSRERGLLRGKPFLARSYADLLSIHGYTSPDVLYAEASAWRALVDVVKPDLVLAEFAPLLCMVTHGREPCIAFGTGFCVPTLGADGVFPVIEPAGTEVLPVAQLRDNVATVMRQLGLQPPDNALRALLGHRQTVVGFSVTDPYREIRALAGEPPASGSLWSLPESVPPMPATPACLVYLPAEHPGIASLAEGLANGLRIPGYAYVRGAGPSLRATLSRGGLEVATQPLNIDDVLSRVSVVLHHGGHGTTERAMAWGRPQALVPMVLEQVITARCLQQMGVARMFVAQDLRGVTGHVNAMATGSGIIDRAQSLAAGLLNEPHRDALAQIVAACEAV